MKTHQAVPGSVAARTAPVVIVGAGPVGVTTAILLARRGVRSILLERHRDVYPLPRAVAMDDEVRRILQAIGIHDEFTAIARPANGLRLLDARHRVMAEFRRDDPQGHHGFPQTTLYDQPALERLLRNALARHPECELRAGVEVVAVEQDAEHDVEQDLERDVPGDRPGRVRVTLRDDTTGAVEHLGADAVLGCDGAGSLTRDAIGAGWEDLRFEETWTVLDVRTDLPVRTWEGVDQVCDPARAGTFMRIGEDRYRWEFRLRPGSEDLRELVAPWVDVPADGDGFEVIRQARYTFRARLADRWRRGRVFLLGDAAHLTPPFIGQGLCAGLRDAHNLSWKLARVLRQGADDRLLDTYQSERKPHARRMIRLAVATGWAMTGGQDKAAAVRRAALGAVCRIPALPSYVSASGLSPALVRGPLVHGRRTGRRLTGTLVPQPWVTADRGRVRLDEVLGDSFAVLSAEPPAPAVRAVAQALGARIVRLDVTDAVYDPTHAAHDETAACDATTVVVDDGTLAAWLRAARADAVLLRPDRVVMDTVPAGGGGFTGTFCWAPLLCTARRPVPAQQPNAPAAHPC
ncbi:bifunctional 3-(3-hydroxy-phenyl)propionate/3-hydroxycinnamic acid hydroxylase [Streptomyces sp. NEAU-YJ-81]|uniref:bifunctional 3-(3-hydroxy-phenyl)propionate/3-hydroxycinnamic acid hydroxylase MhpA n=1 Tax=Streptomyces sp. NEAU-YJ-81 TaxID=2820288 RepID=UPI001ABC1C8B|nr:bifunctional 3-(3-hydroxy-phenyl)propionate/3-hydroxycinnamic acid hydroxylase [Streptomyces sp. NEAU-YJ-81]MBO3676222.1 bifunctional 3-(3-hydroxy-phenyl)propionate/3-hydroxycinnamic acid hydroxylase [Streptomyces sp. NEAU-YJ-81]